MISKRRWVEIETHEPVMVQEVLAGLHINRRGKYIDATLGAGGHSLGIAKLGAQVLGIDTDPEMLQIAQRRLAGLPVKIIQANFRDIDKVAEKEGFAEVSGILFDLGISTLHLKRFQRGFSFEREGDPLDMRLNIETQGIKAADLLNRLSEHQLREMFVQTMEFTEAQRLAKVICQTRETEMIETVGDFLKIIARAGPKQSKLHPATKAFLALRLTVNSELTNLKEALAKAFSLLRKNGRLVVISFHSGEDALVKDFFKELAKLGQAVILTKRPLVPSAEEMQRNPKARSAKLRILEKK